MQHNQIATDLVVVLSVLGFTLSVVAAAWLLRSNYRLAERNRDLEDDNRDLMRDRHLLHDAVSEARHVFRQYASLHQAKGTAEGDHKAKRNQDHADVMDHALRMTDYPEHGVLQEWFMVTNRIIRRAAINAARDAQGIAFLEFKGPVRG